MLKLIGGTAAGVVVWTVIVTLLNLAVRHGWPAYAAVEKAMAFTLPMLVTRLAMSGVSSLAGGATAALIDGPRRAPLASGIVLLLAFLPVHVTIWDRFPVWYHLTFLASLPVVAWIGGRLAGPAVGRSSIGYSASPRSVPPAAKPTRR